MKGEPPAALAAAVPHQNQQDKISELNGIGRKIQPAVTSQPGKILKISASKNWQLPPKPKPGRKPGDTRKARTGSTTSGQIPGQKSVIAKAQSKQGQVPIDRRPGIMPLNKDYNGHQHSHSHDQTHNHSYVHVQSRTIAAEQKPGPDSALLSLDCGLCDSGGHCACDALGIKPKFDLSKVGEGPTFGIDFESFQPMEAVPLKRKSNPNDNKVKKYAAMRITKQQASATPSPVPMTVIKKQADHSKDCGFCGSTDSECLCQSDNGVTKQHIVSTEQKKQFTPGTCNHCLEDPMGTLFCVSLLSAKKPKTKSPLSITCDQTYQTLSRHRKFFDSDLASVVGDLEAEDGMVDVQSISRALRNLDKDHKA